MNKKQNPTSMRYVDLFSGCGGFSLGLESTGAELIFGIEKSPMAAETFMRNLVLPEMSEEDWQQHLQLDIEGQADRRLIVSDVQEAKKNSHIKTKLKMTSVDLIVGGPPCQGFSLAGRRNASDVRNSLAWDFLDFVQIADPKFVVIENVPGMDAKFSGQEGASSSAFNEVGRALQNVGSGYVVQKLLLNAKHYGAAQNRERLFIVGCRVDVAKAIGLSVTGEVWRSQFKDAATFHPSLAPTPAIEAKKAVTLKHAIGDLMARGRESDYVKLLKDHRHWGLTERKTVANTNFRRHGTHARNKFELYIALKNLGVNSLLMRSGLSSRLEQTRGAELQRVKKEISFPIKGTQGQVICPTFGGLVKALDQFGTRKHSQRVLDLNTVAPTVITSPDDYIHPKEPRVLSVRELARLQGFSDHFVFYSKETTGGLKRREEVPQFSQVGNAVSPFVSRALGLMISSHLARFSML